MMSENFEHKLATVSVGHLNYTLNTTAGAALVEEKIPGISSPNIIVNIIIFTIIQFHNMFHCPQGSLCLARPNLEEY